MKPKKWEILIVAVLVAALALWAFFPKEAGRSVTVTVDGAHFQTFPLDQDREVSLMGYGEFTLTLVIAEEKAHVENATCPDLICQHHAPISRVGEQIVCLPGRVVLSVTGEEDEIDAVTR